MAAVASCLFVVCLSGGAVLAQERPDAPGAGTPSSPDAASRQPGDPPVPAETAPVEGTPRLAVEPDPLDFGKTYLGEIAKGALKLSNAGDAPLTIFNIKRKCGCTVVKLRNKVLAPGESVEVPATMKPTASKHGSIFTRAVTIISDDPDRPSWVVNLTTKVIRPIVVEPARVAVNDILVGETRTVGVDLSATEDAEFAITGLEVPEDRPLTVQLTGGAKAGTHHLDFVIGPLEIGENLHETCLVNTDHPRMPQIKLPVMVRAIRPVMLNPRRIVLGNIRPGASVTKQLRVITRPGYEVTEMSLNIQRHPEIEVRAEPRPGSRDVWNLTFDVPLEYAGKLLASRANVTTNVPQAGPLEISISGKVSDSIDLAPELPFDG